MSAESFMHESKTHANATFRGGRKMSTATILSYYYRPTFTTISPPLLTVTPSSCTLESLVKPISFHEFPTSLVSVFLAGSISKTTLHEKNRVWGPKTMTELIGSSVLRSSGDGVEGLGIVEKEDTLSNGSSEFRPDFTPGELQSVLNRLSKWVVAALFGALIIWRHDAEALWAAMGSVINACLSVTLKQILNQERPISTSRSDPGMPSSHAQAIFFAVIFAIVSLVKSLGINEVTVTIGVLALSIGSYLSWLRVWQKLHTMSQVVVGALVGSIFSILWFQLWDAFVLKAFNSFLWVQIFVVVGAAGSCLGFLLHVIRHWFLDEL